MAPRKVDFVLSVRRLATDLSACSNSLIDMCSVYFDSGYDAAGANPITDEDVAAYDLLASDVTDLITLVENLDKFLNDQAPTQGDYSATLNSIINI